MADLNLYGAFNNMGYGAFARGIAKGLFDSGIYDFHICPYGKLEAETQDDLNMLAMQAKAVQWDRSAPAVAAWHEFDLNKFSGSRLFAFPMFETEGLSLAAVAYLKQMDGILVPSNWAKEVITREIEDATPVTVVRCGSEVLETDNTKSISRNSGAFTFLSIGKFEIRKSQIEILQAYSKAFSKSPTDTRLIMHCFTPFENNFIGTMARLLQQLGYTIVTSTTITGSIIAQHGNAIVEIPKQRLAREQIFQLYKYAHVGVFPSKGEGWNLPLVEALKSGLPCIASNVAAHTEYLNEEFAYPKELLLTEGIKKPAYDGRFFLGDKGDWTIPDVGELTEKLKYAVNNYSTIESNINVDKFKTTLTWTNTTKDMLNAIKQND